MAVGGVGSAGSAPSPPTDATGGTAKDVASPATRKRATSLEFRLLECGNQFVCAILCYNASETAAQ